MNRSKLTQLKCFVPSCKNSTTNSRHKTFVYVKECLKKRWSKQVNLHYQPGRRMLCCEDHLDLEKDLENYQYFKLMNGVPRLKSTAKLCGFEDLTPTEPTLLSLLLDPVENLPKPTKIPSKSTKENIEPTNKKQEIVELTTIKQELVKSFMIKEELIESAKIKNELIEPITIKQEMIEPVDIKQDLIEIVEHEIVPAVIKEEIMEPTIVKQDSFTTIRHELTEPTRLNQGIIEPTVRKKISKPTEIVCYVLGPRSLGLKEIVTSYF